jgi:N-formylglutamate amidohydrolase
MVMIHRTYIEFSKGNIPIILSVPHGGNLEIDSIPNRKHGIKGIDKNTIEIARELIKIIQKNSITERKIPSYVFCNVARVKVDINRPKSKAFNNTSELASSIYLEYHCRLRELIYSNLKSFNKSILIDIHGFEAEKRPRGFRDVDVIIGTNNLESIIRNKIPKREWGKNIRGRMIKNFIQKGIDIAPGHRLRGEYVLKGGFITQTYGFSQIENSQALQIELSDRVRIYDKNLRTEVVKILGEVLYREINEPI